MTWEDLKGKFIVLDGPDGCGKSTQAKLLAECLRQEGVECVTVRDPGGTAIGEQIRNILLNTDNARMSVCCETLLYMASRAQLYGECIEPALEQQKCVLSDRWISSTYAYQAKAGEVGAQMLLQVAQASLKRTWPDLTVIIDLPSEEGLARLGGDPDRMESKSSVFHQQVRKAFLELAQGRSDFRVVEGSGSIEEVQERVRKVLADYVNA
jgi:dTMP kinase